MELKFLVETSTLIEILRGRHRVLIEPLTEHSGTITTSSICVSELHYGALRSAHPPQELAKVQSLIAKLPVLEFDQTAAEFAAKVRYDLEEQGIPIGSYDTQIAGHGLATGLTVVTHNLKHLRRVEGLSSVDWLKPRS